MANPETETVLIYGASDDLVEIEGNIEGADEFNVYDYFEAKLQHTDEETWDTESLTVRLEFGRNKGNLDWQISVSAEDSYPSWAVLFTERPGYEGDPAVQITVPKGTILKVVHPTQDEEDED